MASHTVLARRLGATDEQIAALARGDLSAWEEPWQAALRFAEAVTPTPGRVEQSVFDALAAAWSEPQIVEITAVITLFNYFNRFANSLEIPPTR